MRSALVDSPRDVSQVSRKLRLVWKHPETRRYHEVGKFEALPGNRYAFGYSPDAGQIEGFLPLIQFPDLDEVYVSDVLPAFFANRVMSRRRRSYANYVGWLGLDAEAPPIEILARTGGGRATDTFHLVDSFDDMDGSCSGRFFVSGIRYHNEEVAKALRPGQELRMVDEPTNEANPRAILLSADDTVIGWVPDWLVDDLHRLRENRQVKICVEQVNPDSPPNLAVLCRLEASAEHDHAGHRP